MILIKPYRSVSARRVFRSEWSWCESSIGAKRPVTKRVDLNFRSGERRPCLCLGSKRSQNEMCWINLLRSEIKHTLVKGRIRYKPRGEGR